MPYSRINIKIVPKHTQPSTCTPCALFEQGHGFIYPEGQGQIPLMLIGESPGGHEIQDGLPFRPHAQAGGVLERTLARTYNPVTNGPGVPRSSISIHNLISCRPPNDWLSNAPWEHSAVGFCSRVHLKAALERYKPQVLVALGATPLRELTWLSGH